MSYDIYLFKKDGSKNPFNFFDLYGKFQDTKGSIVVDMNGGVTSFEFYFDFYDDYGETDNHSLKFIYQGEKKGDYWVYCNYNVKLDTFNKFKKSICDVSSKLNMLICDNQILKDTLITPEDYSKNQDCSEKFISAKKGAQKARQLILDQKALEDAKISINHELSLVYNSFFFLRYWITSIDPLTQSRVLLCPGENMICAGNVKPGETIDQVLKKDIPEITGSNNYQVQKIVKNSDSARNRNNELIMRHSIFIEIPYFDPTKTRTIDPVQWETI